MVIKLKIVGLDDKMAVLESDNSDQAHPKGIPNGVAGETGLGQKISWPKNKLPKNISIGSILYFSISTEEDTGVNNPGLAKEILNEIIGSDTNNNL